jgi:hypothetical protein
MVGRSHGVVAVMTPTQAPSSHSMIMVTRSQGIATPMTCKKTTSGKAVSVQFLAFWLNHASFLGSEGRGGVKS